MKKINLRSLLPNLITLSGLSFGLSSMRFAIEGEFNLAIICILFAAVCDALDGMLARHLESESDLGFQLDSLSDFLSFECRNFNNARVATVAFSSVVLRHTCSIPSAVRVSNSIEFFPGFK